MVTEAQVQVTRMVRQAVGHVGQLAALAGAELRLLGSSTGGVAGLQVPGRDSSWGTAEAPGRVTRQDKSCLSECHHSY